MNSDLYYKKYLKYKSKYTELKKLYGGDRVQDLICNGFASADKQADSKYIINLNITQFNNMIKLKKIFNFDHFYSYNAAFNFKDSTIGDNIDGSDSTGKFKTMLELKNKGFTNEYSYLGAKDLNEEQIEKMIMMKNKGFAENFAYVYITNSGKSFKKPVPQRGFIQVKSLTPEKENIMFNLKKTDIEAYLEALK